MAVAWSKFVETVPYTCYELAHCWTPYCSVAHKDLFRSGFTESFKVYGALYLATALLRRRKKEYYLKHLLPEVLQSSTFLAVHIWLLCGMLCFWRGVLGSVSLLTGGLLVGVSCSLISILIERKARRSVLAVYFLNLAMETMYRMAVAREMITPVKHGEVLLFSVVSAFYMYFFRKKGGLEPSIQKLLRFIVGNSEAPPGEVPVQRSGSTSPKHQPNGGRGGAITGLLSYLPKEIQALVEVWRRGPRHLLCKHSHSCHASTVEAALRMFCYGYAGQCAVKMVRAVSQVAQRPRGIWDALKHKDNWSLGLFLGGYSGLFKLTSCLMRWLRNKEEDFHGAVAGFVAGASMGWYKSVAITMYLASKLAELIYFKGIAAGILPYIKHGDIIVYALSCGFVLHAGIFEPHNLRPAYWNFMMKVSGQRFKLMNRHLLDSFGTKASTMYPDYYPDYDYRFTQNLNPPPPIKPQ